MYGALAPVKKYFFLYCPPRGEKSENLKLAVTDALLNGKLCITFLSYLKNVYIAKVLVGLIFLWRMLNSAFLKWFSIVIRNMSK